MKWNKKILISERIKTILLFLSVILLMMMFIYDVYNNLFAKDDETKRIEREREEWIKKMK
ncbi:hypothetical protein [Bacillus cereus]|uniref:hypothetical protein n=1 Tax=Bacillus cereus TaxID=1396 RepID=UPI0035C9D161